jgi:signal transduction protein with GAF and PtsI domain
MLTQQILPGRGTLMGRIALEGRPVQIVDALADPEYTYTEAQKVARFRALLGAPLLRKESRSVRLDCSVLRSDRSLTRLSWSQPSLTRP